jgi:hypothetical protein
LGEATPRRRRWRIPGAVAGTIGAAVVLTVLIAVPFAQTAPEGLTLTNSGSLLSAVGQPITFPHGGTFDFSWSTESGRTVTFSVLSPSGTTVYSSDSTGGSASIAVGDTGAYLFEIDDWLPETVVLSGTLHYSAPML